EFRRVLFRSCFFFSSRRRHTRFSRDWSSDVCSSDLGFAGAVRAEDADARAGRQLQLDVVQDGRAVIAQNALAQIQQRVGLAIGLAEAEVERGVQVRRAKGLHAFQRLEAALRLARLGRLGAEAGDVLLHVLALSLLLLEGGLLLAQAFGAGSLELAVAAAIERQLLGF